jgi:nucleoside-diphosphate-sugar epimerase
VAEAGSDREGEGHAGVRGRRDRGAGAAAGAAPGGPWPPGDSDDDERGQTGPADAAGRTEGTGHLLAAAEATGVSHFVAQGYANWNGIRAGGWVKTEDDPLDPMTGTAADTSMAALRHVEDVVLTAGGAVMRYGALYGPGATDDQVELVRKRQFPLAGRATGYSSWVHLADAASATVLAVEQKATGVFNIVDDDPAPASEWLPYLAACAGAKRPMRSRSGWAGGSV